MHARRSMFRFMWLAIVLGMALISGSCNGDVGMGMGYSAPDAGWGPGWSRGYIGGPVTY
jgi:hypothetical protein